MLKWIRRLADKENTQQITILRRTMAQMDLTIRAMPEYVAVLKQIQELDPAKKYLIFLNEEHKEEDVARMQQVINMMRQETPWTMPDMVIMNIPAKVKTQ